MVRIFGDVLKELFLLAHKVRRHLSIDVGEKIANGRLTQTLRLFDCLHYTTPLMVAQCLHAHTHKHTNTNKIGRKLN